MDSKNITKAVCEIAKTFEEKGDLSVVQLLKETGYLECPEMITEDEILKCLKQHPDLLDTWVLYSENQRIPEGWYIKTPVENDSSSMTWKVGWYPDGDIHEFRNKASACAFYVKQEVEQIRKIIEKAR